MSTNLYFYGAIHTYDANKVRIGTLSVNAAGLFDFPSNVYYIRGILNNNVIGTEYLYFNANTVVRYPFLQDRYNYKYKGLKLTTIGDSITYQKSWQPRLTELTGMVWSSDETRGGVGYVEIDPTTKADIGNYVAVDAGIVDSGSTFVNSYGQTLTIYSKAAKRYRKAYSMAEGGETVMPRPGVVRSIYSRCGDAKYYDPDVIIIHAGANDRNYCVTLPTVKPNGRLSDITGITNLESDDPDLISNYEIHTASANYADVGNFSAQGDTTGRVKYSGTFRAAYRGMLKRVIDGNPAAIIFLIQPPRTFLYGETYQAKEAEYAAIELNRVIAGVGREFGCQVIDTSLIFGTYNADQYFIADGLYVHPNDAGGKKIAEYIASQIL
jgi:lysophospholipase L1-like esterase